MTADPASPAFVLNDRTPFPAAAAVIRAVTRRCPDLRHYFEAIRQTGHSVFYYQMQQLYEWAIARCGASGPEDFCREVGRMYAEADAVIGDSIYPFLQAGL